MRKSNKSNLVIIAGGYDLEMLTIINICREAGIEVVDKTLGWGESSAVHAEAVAEAQAAGKTVVFIEPIFDAKFPQPEGSIVIDHHGSYAGRKQSIIQFLELIGEEPTREQQLIAANDEGYIPAMLAMGASAEEIAAIRLADRQAQGIDAEKEAEAERAIAAMEVKNGIAIFRMAHSKTACITDRLDPYRKQSELIISEDGESNYYGSRELCIALEKEFKGWNGGLTTENNAFWGGYGDQEKIEKFVVDYFA